MGNNNLTMEEAFRWVREKIGTVVSRQEDSSSSDVDDSSDTENNSDVVN